jgi:putative Mn2+ efflux pump MntP
MKIFLAMALIAAFALLSMWIGNSIEYYFNHYMDQYGK